MDFSAQHLTDLMQDQVVVILLLGALFTGFFLGKLMARTKAGKASPKSSSTPSPSMQTPAIRTRPAEAATVPLPPASKAEPPVENPHKKAPHSPQSAPVPAAVVPAVQAAPPPAVTEPERDVTGMIDAQIRTRTGENPGKTKLQDPYEGTERQWSAAESTRAVALYRSGKPIRQIAQSMRIDQKQVATHLIRVLFDFKGEIDDASASAKHRKTYTDDELSKMKSYFDAGVQIQEIAAELERTVLGVGWRMIDLRIP